MPTRYLKPGIRDSELIDGLSAEAEVLFYRLLVTVDDFGRADARPSMVKAACFPIKDAATQARCEKWLAELASAGLVDVYSVGGKPYLQVRKWDNTPRAKESKYPPIPAENARTYTYVYKPRTHACNPRTLLPVTVTETETETETDKTPLSGKPDQMAQVREVLTFLRNMTGRQYREVPPTVNLIKSRLKNTPVEDIKRMLVHKGQQWLDDPEMEQFLRPSTLFRPSNFEQYLAEALANA